MTTAKPAAGGKHLSIAACLALCLLAPLSGLAQSGLTPVMPAISVHFASDPNAGMLVRLMVSSVSGAMILGSLVSGLAAERIGQLRLLLISLVIYGLTGAAGYLLDDLYLIVASRIVLGIFTAAAGVLAMSQIMTRVAPEARDRWLGFYIVIGTGGLVVLMAIVGGLAQYGWRTAFLLYLVALPSALFIALTFPREPAGGQEAPVAGQGGSIRWGTILVGLLWGVVATATMMYLPFHLVSLGRGSSGEVALVMMIIIGAGGVGGIAYGWVRKHLDVVPVFVGFLALCALGLALIVPANVPALIFAGSAIYGIGLGIVTPNLYGATAAAVPMHLRARALGFVRAAFFAGPLVAQPPLEFVLHHAGAAATVASLAAVCVLTAVLTVVLKRGFRPLDA